MPAAEIAEIVVFGVDVVLHKKLHFNTTAPGGKAHIECNPGKDHSTMKTILRWCTEKVGIDGKGHIWTDGDYDDILAYQDPRKAMEFFILNDFDFEYKDGYVSAVNKTLPLEGNSSLNVAFSVGSDSGYKPRLKIRPRDGGRLANWDTLGTFGNSFDWDQADFGDKSTRLGDHTEDQKQKWMETMKQQPFGIYIASLAQGGEYRMGIFNQNSIDQLPDIWKKRLMGQTEMVNWKTLKSRSGVFDNHSSENEHVKQVLDLIKAKEPNILMYGPPGTGKTYLCQKIRDTLMAGTISIEDDGTFRPTEASTAKSWWVTFHQSVTYEDFVIGLRPKINNGNMTLVPRAGPLLEAMEFVKGQNAKANAVVFIDEINRGDLSRILGDFITYMDMDKRGVVSEDGNAVVCTPDTLPLRFSMLDQADGNGSRSEPILLGGKYKKFGIRLMDGNYIVPPNLTIIATMNSLDRSVAPMDSAMKRRFHQINIDPDAKIIRKVLGQKENPEVDENLIKLSCLLMESLNEWLENLFNEDIQIGPSYFLKATSLSGLADIWDRKILPLLLDLCRSSTKRAELVRLMPQGDELFGRPVSNLAKPLKPGSLSSEGLEDNEIALYVASIINNAINNDQELKALLDRMIPPPPGE